MPSNPSLEVMSVRKRALFGGGIGLLVALLVGLLRGTEAFERPELALVDTRTNAFVGTRDPDPRIVLAVVGEKDIKKAAEIGFRSWPWPQNIQAYGVECVERAGAKALVLDFLYLDRGKSPQEVGDLAAMNETERTNYQQQVADEFEAATALGDALSRYGRAVVGLDLVRKPVWQFPAREALVVPFDRGVAKGPSRFDLGAADLPVPALLSGAGRIGFVSVSKDLDGVLRSAGVVGFWNTLDGRAQSVLSVAAAGAELLADQPLEVILDDSPRVLLGETEQALSPDGSFLVNFRGEPFKSYKTVSVFDLVETGARLIDEEPLEPYQQELFDRLEGKLVIWGASFAADLDVLATPTDRLFLGPEFHATAIDNLLHGDGRVRASRGANFLLLLLLCAGLGTLGTIDRARGRPFLVLFGAMIAFVGLAFGVFRAGMSIDMFTPLLGIGTTGLATAVFRLTTEGRRNKWLESTFSRYLSPDVIEALKADPSRLQLGGRRAELTIFFSDVAGFTSLTERLKPEETVSLLNRYLTRQSSELMTRGATIDKFEGDAIMAFFGDPLPTETHAIDACRAAVLCYRALPALESLWRELGLEGFDIRIGLNSGTVLVGNMGSDERFDYTCMGDAVNLAARLEGANKAFGSKIMIGPLTYEQAESEILAKRLADIIVMGKTKAVRVYELYAMREDATDTERAHVAAWDRAHAALREGDIEGARAALDEAGEAAPGDGPVGWLRGIADALAAGEIESPWDAKLVLDRK